MSTSLQPFEKRDFLAYEKHRQDDPEYNGLRLSVRRKLKALAEAALAQVEDASFFIALERQ